MDDDVPEEVFLFDEFHPEELFLSDEVDDQLFSRPLDSMNEEEVEEENLDETSFEDDEDVDSVEWEEETDEEADTDEDEHYETQDFDFRDDSDDEETVGRMMEDYDEGNDDDSGDEVNDNADDEDSHSSESTSNNEPNNSQLQQDEQANASGEENIVQTQKRIKLDLSVEKPAYCTLDDTSDDDQKCPICLDSWTNAGEHRLCSLRCGHLFGLSCITEWLARSQGNGKNCPECKAKASKKDIRVLYARRLICIDTVEKEKLQKELEELTQKQKFMEQELALKNTKEVLYKQEMSYLKQKVQELEKKIKLMSAENSSFGVPYDNVFLKRSKIFDICTHNGCRVMAYNPWNKILAVSSGNAINRIFMNTASTSLNVNIHSGCIRDLAFEEQHPNYLLSVGFDKRVVLTDIRNNTLTHSYQADTNLWSCCWSNYNHQTFFVGGAKGNVIEYDIRYLQSSVANRENTEDRSPVVSLAAVPMSNSTFCAGGYLVCQLNSCYAYSYKEGNYVGNRIDFEGPFISLRYNETDNHVLLSCRASSKYPTVRHVVCTLDKKDDEIKFNTVHSFSAGNTQKLLSRPCYMNLPNDTMVIANNESLKSIVAWSISSGKEAYSLPMTEPVVDMCAFEYDGTYQAILTSNKLHLFQYKNPNV